MVNKLIFKNLDLPPFFLTGKASIETLRGIALVSRFRERQTIHQSVLTMAEGLVPDMPLTSYLPQAEGLEILRGVLVDNWSTLVGDPEMQPALEDNVALFLPSNMLTTTGGAADGTNMQDWDLNLWPGSGNDGFMGEFLGACVTGVSMKFKERVLGILCNFLIAYAKRGRKRNDCMRRM